MFTPEGGPLKAKRLLFDPKVRKSINEGYIDIHIRVGEGARFI